MSSPRKLAATAAMATMAVIGLLAVFSPPLADPPAHPAFPMQSGSQRSEVASRDSECGYACPIDVATLICDVDGSWVAWLMPGQSVRVPIGECSREDLPTVFDAMGEVTNADIIVVGE